MSIIERIKGFILRKEPVVRDGPRRDIPLEAFKTVIKAKSSNSGFYEVTFTCNGERLWLKCTCIAGKFSQFCKHKFQLLEGNATWLYDPQHRAELAHIQSILPQTNFPLLLNYYKEALSQGDTQAIKETKAQLKMAMRQGA